MASEQEIRDRIVLLEAALDEIGVGSPTLYALGMGARSELQSLLDDHQPSMAEVITDHADKHRALGWWNETMDAHDDVGTSPVAPERSEGDIDEVGGTT